MYDTAKLFQLLSLIMAVTAWFDQKNKISKTTSLLH